MPVLTKINTNVIADDAITGAKFAGDTYLENTTTQNLSGTYAESRLYTSDAYTLTGDTTVNGNLVLSSVKGDSSDITLTTDSTTRTITGTGKLEGGSIVAKVNTDLTGMTGELGSTVTNNAGVASGTIGSAVTIPRGANGVATVHVKKTTSQSSISTSEANATVCTFDTAQINVGGHWNDAANGFTVPQAGIYRLGWGGSGQAGNDTVYRMYFWLNGSKHVDGQLRLDNPTGEYQWGSRTHLISLSVGDYLDIHISIDSATTTWYCDANLQTYFSIEFLG